MALVATVLLAVGLTGCTLPFPGEYTDAPLKLSKVDGNLAVAYCGDPGTLVFVDMWVARRSNTARGSVSFEASGSAEIVRGAIIETAALPAGLTVTTDAGYATDPDNVAVTLEVDGVQSFAQFFFEDDVGSIEDWRPNGWMRGRFVQRRAVWMTFGCSRGGRFDRLSDPAN